MAIEQLEIIREFSFEFYGDTYRAYLGTERKISRRSLINASQEMECCHSIPSLAPVKKIVIHHG
jgi:hypothetical protein